ncbi:hypothetical protein SDC9_207879 [bioreactor metagenome]|uniref:Uncharacterized protein n=1 Tax=bioreactor metagenome TaxID=1076179 RepID=A0A645JIJ0_9ZZZZ
MVESAETNVVRPAVTAEDPNGFFRQIIAVVHYGLCGIFAAVFGEF